MKILKTDYDFSTSLNRVKLSKCTTAITSSNYGLYASDAVTPYSGSVVTIAGNGDIIINYSSAV